MILRIADRVTKWLSKESSLSVIFSIVVLMALFYSSQVFAVNLNINSLPTSIAEATNVSFLVSIDIEDGEIVPFVWLNVTITNSQNSSERYDCVFNTSGQVISGCSDFGIGVNSKVLYGNYSGQQAYGYNSSGNFTTHYFGSGYGYGFANTSIDNNSFPYGELSYNITWMPPDVLNSTDFYVDFTAFATDGTTNFTFVTSSPSTITVLDNSDDIITLCPSGCDYSDVDLALKALNNTNKTLYINDVDENLTYYANGGYLINVSDPDGNGVIVINHSLSFLFLNNTKLYSSTGTGYGIILAKNSTYASNATLIGFYIGIFAKNVDSVGFLDITLNQSSGAFNTTTNSLFDGIYVFNSTDGLVVQHSSNASINHSIVHNNIEGIRIVNSTDCTLDNSISYDNGNEVYFELTRLSKILSSIIYSTSGSYQGIYFVSSDNNLVSGNNLTKNTPAIALQFSHNNTFVDNEIFKNIGAISLSGSSDNVIANNSLVLEQLNPIANYQTTSTTITFSANVSNFIGTSACYLYINDSLNSTDTTVSDFTLIDIPVDLTLGTYSWYMRCNDSSNNSVTTSSRELEIYSSSDCLVPDATETISSNTRLCINESPYNASFTVVLSGITFDCMGAQINGAYFAFMLSGVDNVTITNCTISNSTYGIYFDDSHSNTVDANIYDSTYAMFFYDSENTTSQLDVNRNDYVAYFSSSSGNIIHHTNMCGNSFVTNNIAGNSLNNNSFCTPLLSPSDNGMVVGDVDFRFNTSNMIYPSTCTLMINGTSYHTVFNSTGNFTESLQNKSYQWSINCSDAYDNIGNSSTYTLNVGYVDFPMTISPVLINSSINLSLVIMHNLTQYNFTFNGSINTNLTYGTYDLKFTALQGDIVVDFENYNHTTNSDFYFGVDTPPTIAGDLVTYAIDTNISGNASITFDYSGLAFSNENYLEIYKSQWNFGSRINLSGWVRQNITSQDTTNNLITVEVSSFSGFAIRQGSIPSTPSSGSSSHSSSGAWVNAYEFECSYSYECPANHVCVNRVCIFNPTCTDGIQNQGEEGVDCGGPCDPCVKIGSCNDGIQNRGELGIDCGGPCDPCSGNAMHCSNGMRDADETGVDCGGSCSACSAIEQPIGLMMDENRGILRFLPLFLLALLVGAIGFVAIVSKDKFVEYYHNYLSHKTAERIEKDRLQKYVDHALTNGFPEEKIRQVLLRVGWPASLIDECIQKRTEAPQEQYFEFADEDVENIDLFN